jgi:hypothetical protein
MNGPQPRSVFVGGLGPYFDGSCIKMGNRYIQVKFAARG